MDIPWIQATTKNKVSKSLTYLDNLWVKISKKYKHGDLKHLKYVKIYIEQSKSTNK